jgi:hypothetical protein
MNSELQMGRRSDEDVGAISWIAQAFSLTDYVEHVHFGTPPPEGLRAVGTACQMDGGQIIAHRDDPQVFTG